MQEITPVSGGVLDQIVELDRCLPGYAGHYFRASNERRQVVAAHLAVVRPLTCSKELGERADFLQKARHGTILEAAFGEVPNGLRGALSRSGPQAHEPLYYSALFRTLKAPQHSAFSKTFTQLTNINLVRLRIARLLPAPLCAPGLVESVRSVREARDIVRLLELLRAHGVSEEALGEAAHRIGRPRQLPDLWRRWALKARFPEHPIPASGEYRPVVNGEALSSLATRYRNCALRYLPQVLDGRHAFAEFMRDDISLVVHLRRLSGAWRIEGLFGRANVRPRRQHCETVVKHLRQFEVREREVEPNPGGAWQVLRRLTSPPTFDFDFEAP